MLAKYGEQKQCRKIHDDLCSANMPNKKITTSLSSTNAPQAVQTILKIYNESYSSDLTNRKQI